MPTLIDRAGNPIADRRPVVLTPAMENRRRLEMNLAFAAKAEVPGHGKVAKIGGEPCAKCGERRPVYFSATTGELIKAPPCDHCLTLAVIHDEVGRWQELPPGPPVRPIIGDDEASKRVATGLVYVPSALRLPTAAWHEALGRHVGGLWGWFADFDVVDLTPADRFAPELASVFARNRVAAEAGYTPPGPRDRPSSGPDAPSRAGVVRSRHPVPGEPGNEAEVVDVATFRKAEGPPATYLMVRERTATCFGVRFQAKAC